MTPARTGGLESVVVQLTSGLRSHGHDAQVAAVLAPGTEHDHPVVQVLRERGVPVHVLVLGVRDYRGERRAVRALIRQIGAQVVHTHGYRADVLLGDVARREGCAHVMTLHGFVSGSRRNRLYEWMQIQAARYANGVIAVSQPIVDRLRRHGIHEHVSLLRNAMAPVQHPLPRDVARQALDLPRNVPIVGWVGRVSHEKGPDLFVEAIARLDDAVHGAIVGDGPELDAAKQLAMARRVTNRLHFTGLIESASRYLAAFDGLALTSRTEGTPMILLECMSAGVPIVATNVGGVPDILSQDEALLCGPEDSAGLARAIHACVNDPEKAATRAAAAAARLLRENASEPWIARHSTLYRSMLPC